MQLTILPNNKKRYFLDIFWRLYLHAQLKARTAHELIGYNIFIDQVK